MKPWRLAKSLIVLRAEVNKTYPDRPKGKDGTIGDEAHQADRSDHNPNPPHDGVVTAWDITTDPTFTDALAAKLRAMAKASDGRVKYVIFKGRYASAKTGWEWAKYTGRSKHFDHIHLSVSDDPKQYDRTDPWHAFASPSVTAHATNPTVLEDDMPVIVAIGKGHFVTDFMTKRPILGGTAEERALLAAGVKKSDLDADAVRAIPDAS